MRIKGTLCVFTVCAVCTFTFAVHLIWSAVKCFVMILVYQPLANKKPKKDSGSSPVWPVSCSSLTSWLMSFCVVTVSFLWIRKIHQKHFFSKQDRKIVPWQLKIIFSVLHFTKNPVQCNYNYLKAKQLNVILCLISHISEIYIYTYK